MKNEIVEKINTLLNQINNEKGNTQTSQAIMLVKIKALADIVKGCFDEQKDLYINNYGLGSIDLDNAKLTITESVRNTTDWKGIAENNIESELLKQLIADNTTATKTTTCRITAKLV